jgi:uncharacterized membrane protein YqgA involved in biofilm formation
VHLWGYIVNTATVLLGSGLGLLIGTRLPESFKKIILSALGLSTILIGMQMALGTKSLLLVVGSLIAGGIIGQLIGIEEWLERMGEKLRKRFEPANANPEQAAGVFVLGFVTASLLFCTGPMTIVGSIEDGFAQKPDLIYIKSLMDCVAAIALTTSLGIGVIFSAITVFVIQGLLTYLGMFLGSSLGEPIMVEISAVGGALVMGIGFNLLGFGKIRVGNFVPALIIAGFLAWLIL